MTGPSREVRATVLERAQGRCERCRGPLDGPWGYSLHHRRPRGSGGSRQPWINAPTNLIAVCGSATSPGGCHYWAESQRTAATALGYLCRMGDQPDEIPFMDIDGRWWLLTDDTKTPFLLPAVLSQQIALLTQGAS
jgi:5-methylcytosine-specific restriction enzyme A